MQSSGALRSLTDLDGGSNWCQDECQRDPDAQRAILKAERPLKTWFWCLSML